MSCWFWRSRRSCSRNSRSICCLWSERCLSMIESWSSTDTGCLCFMRLDLLEPGFMLDEAYGILDGWTTSSLKAELSLESAYPFDETISSLYCSCYWSLELANEVGLAEATGALVGALGATTFLTGWAGVAFDCSLPSTLWISDVNYCSLVCWV